MKLGIIGATGMLGRHTLNAALNAGHDVSVIYRNPLALQTLSGLSVNFRQADLDDRQSLESALNGLHGVINAAAYYPTLPRDWRLEVKTAVAQMDNFYRAAEAVGVAKIVYLGGAIALPVRPDGLPANGSERNLKPPVSRNAYLQVKWAMDDQALREAEGGMPVVIGVPAMTLGEYDYGPTTGQIITSIATGKVRKYVRGNRNAVYGGDAGRGMVLALERGQPGRRYLLTGSNTDMKTLTALIAQLTHMEPPKAISLPLAKVSARLQGWKYRLLGGEPPILSDTAIAVMSAGQFLDGSLAKADLGYVPQASLEETLRYAIDFFRDQGVIPPDTLSSSR